MSGVCLREICGRVVGRNLSIAGRVDIGACRQDRRAECSMGRVLLYGRSLSVIVAFRWACVDRG